MEWFVVWAKNKREAFLQIDPLVAEPNMSSLRELHAPGFVNFTADFDEQHEGVYFWPPKEDVEHGYWLVFGGSTEQDDNVEEFICEVMLKKVKEVKDPEEFIGLSRNVEICTVRRLGGDVLLTLTTPRYLYTYKAASDKAEDILKKLKCKTREI